ncbi:MAG: hypothetical protein ABIV63_20425 [Caldimonas sp.]
MTLPSLSLNPAALAPPAVTMPPALSWPGMSSCSNTTPRPFSSTTSRSTSSTSQKAWLASDAAPMQSFGS